MTNFRLAQETIETWDGYVNQSAQEFMTLSRQSNPDIVYQDAVAEYVSHINEMFSDLSHDPLTEEQLDDIARSLETYLEATRGEEWN